MAGGEGGGGAAAVADVPSLAVRVVAGDGAYLEVIAYLFGHNFTNEFVKNFTLVTPALTTATPLPLTAPKWGLLKTTPAWGTRVTLT
jgi:hypothetical protein